MVNRVETEKFLKLLEPKGDQFTFQTFDDNNERKSKSLVHVLHGTLDQHYEQLCRLNKAGAGIYITVNETDLKGRKAQNITRVRAVFADLDGAPLKPALQKPLPQIVVESSPKRWHCYWLVKDMPVDAKIFRNAQKNIIKRLKSDPAVVDLPRVLRLPGFVHQKGKHFNVRVTTANTGIKPYKAKTFIVAEETKPATAQQPSDEEPVNIQAIKIALEIIPADDYKIWFEIGCALAHELKDSGFEIFDRWSRKSDKYSKDKCELKWEECKKITKFTAATIYFYATEIDPHWREVGGIPIHAAIEDFVAFLPQHNYIYLPTGQSWPKGSVNARLAKVQVGAKRMLASDWLDRYQKAEGITWSPADPEIISDRVTREQGGWIEKPGTQCLNLYYPPTIVLGSRYKAQRWIELVETLFPNDATHIIDFMAHRVQFPGVKINHALLLGGEQGIGKDTLLEPVKQAIGPWNFVEISPKDVVSRFNAHIKSVICRISEARDTGETNRYDFYETMKTLCASPPDVLQCEEKHMKKYAIANVTAIVITTNHKTGGIYLPPGDRRTYVAWSNVPKDSLDQKYWDGMWMWYNQTGYADIAAFLKHRDLTNFNPKAPPKQTEAFKDIVEANLPMEDAEFATTLNLLNRPKAVTIPMLIEITPSHSFASWLEERRNHRLIPHRLEACGYVAVRNPDNGHNRWRYRLRKAMNGHVLSQQFDTAVYVLKDLPEGARISAARGLISQLQAASL